MDKEMYESRKVAGSNVGRLINSNSKRYASSVFCVAVVDARP
jgi:hypothetical protein